MGLASLGHTVTAVDTDARRARRFQRGMGADSDVRLSKQMKLAVREGKLKFTPEPETSLTHADVVIIAGVPGSSESGIPDRAAVLRTAECLTGAAASYSTVIVTASAPTGSCRLLQDWMNDALPTGAAQVVACPVFFAAPDGLVEFLNPDRIVLGYENESARRVVDELFANMLQNDPPVCHVSWEAAEMMRSTTGSLAAALPSGAEGSQKTEENAKEAFSRIGQRR